MCGINGIIRLDHKSVEKSLIENMNKALKTRGPDDQGVFVSGSIGLGQTRLAIIDLSDKGFQPMFYSKNLGACSEKHLQEQVDECRLGIVFNGEIYNYKELRQELASLGYQFSTASDTEVILAAYDEWGVDCVQKFNGMWAFCIHDKRRNALFISRDRLGQKPLFFCQKKDTFIFSSEMKAFLTCKLGDEIDESAIYDYFTYGYIPSPKTIYKEIKKLEPGHNLLFKIEKKELTDYRYWNPLVQEQKGDFFKIQEKSFEVLKDASYLRLRSDVPVGIFLSNGLDSSTIAWLLKKNKIKCFNVVFNEKERSEVKALSKHLDLNLEQVDIDQIDYDTVMKKVGKYYDEPFGDNSSIPTYLISKKAKEKNFTVLLSGDGGDELFLGYTQYKHIKYFKSNCFKGLFRLIFRMADKLCPGHSLTKISYCLSLKDIRDYYIKLRGGFTREEKEKILSKEFLDKFKEYNEYWLFDKHWPYELKSSVKKAQVFDIFTYLPEDILVKSDRMSMMNSLELRSPFLDYRLYEHVLKFDTKIFEGPKTKHLVRSLMKNKLPDYIVEGKKKGFGYNINKTIGRKNLDFLKPTAIKYLLNKKKIFILNSLFTLNLEKKTNE